jgi:hypothetical protein
MADWLWAQAQPLEWFQLFRPEIAWVLIPLSAILVWAIHGTISLYHRHRERMAMIEHGMYPDGEPTEAGGADPAKTQHQCR